MAGTAVPSIPVSRRWRLRLCFSLRTLVLGVLVYTSLWTATELCGGRDFRTRIETQRQALHQATAEWARNEVCEADLWEEESAEGFGQDHGDEAAIGETPRPLSCLLAHPCRSSGVDGGETSKADVRSFCSVETLAVAPFLMRVQYTYGCTDGAGRSLPPVLSELQSTHRDAQGWAIWFFGYVLRVGDGW